MQPDGLRETHHAYLKRACSSFWKAVEAYHPGPQRAAGTMWDRTPITPPSAGAQGTMGRQQWARLAEQAQQEACARCPASLTPKTAL